MFFILGFRTKDTVVGHEQMTCEVCGVYAAQTLLRRSTKFTLFFIPLFPVKRSTYYRQCTHCGTARR